MALDTNKNSYTIIFAIAMVVVVGSLLAFTASSLKSSIAANKRTEKQQNILFTMGITDPNDPNSFVSTDEAEALFEKYIGDEQYIVTNGESKKSTEAFDIVVKKEGDRVKEDPNYIRKMPLFVGKKDGEEFYIIPLRGTGLWGPIWGYVALDKKFSVVKGAFFDHQTETAGLGANITETFFREDFIGESILNASGEYTGITVAKGNADPKNEDKKDNEVDALAGATITGDGITAMVKNGIKMYQPYFKNLD